MSRQQYRFATTAVSGWPKLGWVAVMQRGSGIVRVLHGQCVETTPDWCVEAAWAGNYAAGDFDRTDLIAGTGVRLRGQNVVFVSSGDTLSRLHYHQSGDLVYVSNSLPLLLAIVNATLLPDYDYADAMHSIVNGLESYQRQIPSSAGPIHLTYFRNLVVSPTGVAEQDKPCTAPVFRDFATYWSYLVVTARQFGDNAGSSQRTHRITPLATLSKGYDSPAAAVLAREAGTKDAATITRARRQASELLDTDDSGEGLARQLGLRPRCYSRHRKNYPSEDAAWASEGNIGDINLTLFDYPETLCLLFTGFMGDVLWGMDTGPQPEPLHRKDTSGARFSECRLDLGVFNCAPAFWGCQREHEILALSHLPEMAPWTLGTSYDRPIPRRILEEAGVKRKSFGVKKKAASFNRRYGRPLSENLRSDFAGFMRRQKKRARSGMAERTSLLLKGIDSRVLRKLPRPIRFSAREWITLPEPSMFFLWANDRRRRIYRAALNEVIADPIWTLTDPKAESVAVWESGVTE